MKVKIVLLTALGFVFLGLGAIGLILPVLPTTPFVLLSAACFSHSPRIKAQVMKITFFREHIENYKYRKGLSRKNVTISLSYLWVMLLISILVVEKLWVALLLLAIGSGVTTHILLMAKGKNRVEEYGK